MGAINPNISEEQIDEFLSSKEVAEVLKGIAEFWGEQEVIGKVEVVSELIAVPMDKVNNYTYNYEHVFAISGYVKGFVKLEDLHGGRDLIMATETIVSLIKNRVLKTTGGMTNAKLIRLLQGA